MSPKWIQDLGFNLGKIDNINCVDIKADIGTKLLELRKIGLIRDCSVRLTKLIPQNMPLNFQNAKLKNLITANGGNNNLLTHTSTISKGKNLAFAKRIIKIQTSFACSDCTKSFSSKCHYQRHLKIHTGEKPFQCSMCEYKCNERYHLGTHIKRVHVKEKSYSCSMCEKDFVVYGELLRHVRSHTGEKPFKCSVCSKQFSSSGGLQRHLRIHTGEKPYKCVYCTATFGNWTRRHEHVLRFHLNNTKRYICSFCSNTFGTKIGLNNHILSHTGEKPYKCDICSRRFSLRPNLKRHQKNVHYKKK